MNYKFLIFLPFLLKIETYAQNNLVSFGDFEWWVSCEYPDFFPPNLPNWFGVDHMDDGSHNFFSEYYNGTNCSIYGVPTSYYGTQYPIDYLTTQNKNYLGLSPR
jgi:hypothetical protein